MITLILNDDSVKFVIQHEDHINIEEQWEIWIRRKIGLRPESPADLKTELELNKFHDWLKSEESLQQYNKLEQWLLEKKLLKVEDFIQENNFTILDFNEVDLKWSMKN